MSVVQSHLCVLQYCSIFPPKRISREPRFYIRSPTGLRLLRRSSCFWRWVLFGIWCTFIKSGAVVADCNWIKLCQLVLSPAEFSQPLSVQVVFYTHHLKFYLLDPTPSTLQTSLSSLSDNRKLPAFDFCKNSLWYSHD